MNLANRCDRGRSARNTSQRSAYHKRNSRKGPSYIPIPSLPQDLVDLALKALPTSDLFVSAFRDDGSVDESGLDQWDLAPPYPTSQTSFTITYTSNLVDVVHGRRLRNVLKEGKERMDAYLSRARLYGVRKGTLAAEMEEIERWKGVLGAH